MSVSTADVGGAIGLAIDAKEEKAQDKLRKGAVKELASVYKQWYDSNAWRIVTLGRVWQRDVTIRMFIYDCRCQLIKSKDVKQLNLVGENYQDDNFLLGGGGMSALAKAIGAKVR